MKTINKVIWLTGLSGAGKSTIAQYLYHELTKRNVEVFIIDGDNLREQYKDLGFSKHDREVQIKRAATLAKEKLDKGFCVIVALISPFRNMRDFARESIGYQKVIEVYINTPLSICEDRDTKGLYKKARLGLVSNMTGIDSVYEIPENCEITIDTSEETPKESSMKILDYITK